MPHVEAERIHLDKTQIEDNLDENTTGETPEQFQHETLDAPSDQIRLIRFAPPPSKSDEEELCLEISTWNASDAPSYVAISYTWGDINDTRAITINGKSFTVRQNCHYALWQAGQHAPTDYIWIDSICINQADVDEKGHQVQKMAGIYANASVVCVCVGPHADGSERLLEYGKEVHEIIDSVPQLDPLREGFYYPQHRSNSFHGCWDSHEGQISGHPGVGVFRAFIDRPYWTRLWVLQEIAFGKTKVVLCGDDLLEWPILESIEHSLRLPSTTCHFETIIYYTIPGRVSVTEAMTHFAKFSCADERDRIYGILGLIEWKEGQTPIRKPDYNLSSFDVLLRLLFSLDFNTSAISNAMQIFGICFQHRQMGQLQSFARNDLSSSLSETMDRPSFQPIRSTLQKLTDEMAPICIDSSGNLFVNFHSGRHVYYHPPSSSPQPLPLPLFDKQEFINTAKPTTKPIYSNGEVVALTCAATHPGDILMPSPMNDVDNSSWMFGNLLVLRHMKDDNYSIIGQALCDRSYRLSNPSHNQDIEYELAFSFTAEEVILLWGLDFVHVSEEGPPIYDPKARLKRLETPVVLYPDLGIRATLRRVPRHRVTIPGGLQF